MCLIYADVASFAVDGVSVLKNRQYGADLDNAQSMPYQGLEDEFCDVVCT